MTFTPKLWLPEQHTYNPNKRCLTPFKTRRKKNKKARQKVACPLFLPSLGGSLAQYVAYNIL
ncbi:MAG: hypothetical protein PHR87_09255, partial [Sulfurospirillaceae bacterium]|nr:hypothetical protein [Sulfurospirillaceae bacterium]